MCEKGGPGESDPLQRRGNLAGARTSGPLGAQPPSPPRCRNPHSSPPSPGGSFFSCGPALQGRGCAQARGGLAEEVPLAAPAARQERPATSRPRRPGRAHRPRYSDNRAPTRPPRPGFPPSPDAGLTRILRLISVPISMAPEGGGLNTARRPAY